MATIIPVVAGIHYDDIAKRFRLKITLELMSPLGNKRVEEVFDLGDLATVVAKIAEIWALAAGHSADDKLGYVVGDFPAFGATMAGWTPPSYVPQTIPAGFVDTARYDPGDWTPPTDWGETGP